PYVRYSIRGAHWFLARALAGVLESAGLTKDRIDGLCVSSFTMAPDSAVGLTQHLGLTVRWLDHIPMGGAAGVVALRRAARAVQCGDAEIVACVAGDTNQVDSFRQMNANFSQFARGAQGGGGERGGRGAGDGPGVFVLPEEREFQPLRARRGLPARSRRAQCELRLSDRLLHADLWRPARGLRQAMRGPARQRAQV